MPMVSIRWLSLILSLAPLTAAHAQAAETGTVKLPDDLVFRAPLAVAGGAQPAALQTALLYGDPTKPGIYVLRIKLAPGYKSPPHFHKEEFRGVTVLSGTLYFAVSDVWDDSKLKAYPAGTFFTEPPNMAHYAATKDSEVVFDVTGIGPTSTVPIQRTTQ